jgi:hypothetical protein
MLRDERPLFTPPSRMFAVVLLPHCRNVARTGMPMAKPETGRSASPSADSDTHRCRQAYRGTAHFHWSTYMLKTLGRQSASFANIGIPLALAALVSGGAHAFTAPTAGDLGYDIYDIVVNKGVKGPLGFVGGVAAFLFGVSRLFSNVMVGIPTIVAAVCLIKSDTILQTFGMVI